MTLREYHKDRILELHATDIEDILEPSALNCILENNPNPGLVLLNIWSVYNRVEKRELAEALHIAPSHLSRIIRGRSRATRDIQYRIYEITGIPTGTWDINHEQIQRP